MPISFTNTNSLLATQTHTMYTYMKWWIKLAISAIDVKNQRICWFIVIIIIRLKCFFSLHTSLSQWIVELGIRCFDSCLFTKKNETIFVVRVCFYFFYGFMVIWQFLDFLNKFSINSSIKCGSYDFNALLFFMKFSSFFVQRINISAKHYI